MAPHGAARQQEVAMTKLYRLVRLGDAKALTKGPDGPYTELVFEPNDQPTA